MKRLFGSLAALVLIVTAFFSPTRAAQAATTSHLPATGKLADNLKAALAKFKAPFSRNHPATPRKYTVRPGDCLWFLAQRFFGNGDKWRSIYARNKGAITDPNLIYPGQVLTIVGATQDKRDPVSPPASSPVAPPAERIAGPAHHHSVVHLASDFPLRAVHGLIWERTDMGVDFGGSGPLYAVGSGTIISTLDAGWPYGVYILERIDHGPGAGKYIYYAEDVTPSVVPGQHVDEHTVIGTLNGGGIEVGWGTATPGQTLSAANGTYAYDGDPTPEGQDMRQFLHSLKRRHHRHHSPPVVTAACHSTLQGGAGNLPENFKTIIDFLVSHGYNDTAAAGIAGNMWQESGGNPESVGSGGGGLIGWTPLPGGLVTGDPNTDLMRQLEAVLLYDNTVGSLAQINAAATSPAAAADNYSNNYEHPGLPALANREAAAEAVAQACGF